MMGRGLLIRTAIFVFGAVPFMSALHLLDISPEWGGILVVVYVFLGSNYLGHYLVTHEEELPTRSSRR
jgi:hypothetical protein